MKFQVPVASCIRPVGMAAIALLASLKANGQVTPAPAYELQPGDIVTHEFSVGHNPPLTVVCREPQAPTESEIRNHLGGVRYITPTGKANNLMGAYFRCSLRESGRASLKVDYSCKTPSLVDRIKDTLTFNRQPERTETLTAFDVIPLDDGSSSLRPDATQRLKARCPSGYELSISRIYRDDRRLIQVIGRLPQM